MRRDGTCATRDADADDARARARARDDDGRRAWDRPRSHRVAIDVEQSRALAHRRLNACAPRTADRGDDDDDDGFVCVIVTGPGGITRYAYSTYTTLQLAFLRWLRIVRWW